MSGQKFEMTLVVKGRTSANTSGLQSSTDLAKLIEAYVKRLNYGVEVLLEKVHYPQEDYRVDIKNYLRDGKKISAIKRLREEFPGLGLRECRAWVEMVNENLK